MKKILIAIDEGPTSEKVASMGFQLAKELHAEVALLGVVDTTFLVTEGGITPNEMAHMIKAEFQKNQQIIIDSVFKQYPIRSFIEEGNPYEIILKVADEWSADLLVLGTHGRTGLSYLLMGSVAEKIVKHSKKPMYIIPTG